MCGKDRCIYYGCDWCCRWLKGDIIHLHRNECDCLNETWAELCSEQCQHAYEHQILDECTCGTSRAELTYGPSLK